jgi:hypothetical protein
VKINSDSNPQKIKNGARVTDSCAVFFMRALPD